MLTEVRYVIKDFASHPDSDGVHGPPSAGTPASWDAPESQPEPSGDSNWYNDSNTNCTVSRTLQSPHKSRVKYHFSSVVGTERASRLARPASQPELRPAADHPHGEFGHIAHNGFGTEKTMQIRITEPHYAGPVPRTIFAQLQEYNSGNVTPPASPLSPAASESPWRRASSTEASPGTPPESEYRPYDRALGRQAPPRFDAPPRAHLTVPQLPEHVPESPTSELGSPSWSKMGELRLPSPSPETASPALPVQRIPKRRTPPRPRRLGDSPPPTGLMSWASTALTIGSTIASHLTRSAFNAIEQRTFIGMPLRVARAVLPSAIIPSAPAPATTRTPSPNSIPMGLSEQPELDPAADRDDMKDQLPEPAPPEKDIAFSTLQAEMLAILERIHRLNTQGSDSEMRREVARLVAVVTNFQRLFSPIRGLPESATVRVQLLQDNAKQVLSYVDSGWLRPLLMSLLNGAMGIANDIIRYHMPEGDEWMEKNRGLIGVTIDTVNEVFNAFRALVAVGEAHHDEQESEVADAYASPRSLFRTPERGRETIMHDEATSPASATASERGRDGERGRAPERDMERRDVEEAMTSPPTPWWEAGREELPAPCGQQTYGQLTAPSNSDASATAQRPPRSDEWS